MKVLMITALFLSLVMGGISPGEAQLKCRRNFITWVVPFGAGGGTDRWARILSTKSIDVFGMAMHVVNKPGAAGVVGWKYVLSRPPDGCTILQASTTPMTGLIMEENPPINLTDIKIVAFISYFRTVAYAKPGKPWSTWDGLVKYAKANPGKITMGGSISNMLGLAHVTGQAGIKITYVPYDGSGKAKAGFLGGHINLFVASVSAALDLVPKRALPVINGSALKLKKKLRMTKFKNAVEATEIGFKGLKFPRWVGVHPKTPEDKVEFIEKKLYKLIKTKAVRMLIKKVGEEIMWLPHKTAQQAYNYIIPNLRKASKLIK
jgi:tripartite-type tricarboxylate transporter receptor subunit TctC